MDGKLATENPESPHLSPPRDGEVLAAGRARGQALQGTACSAPLSVGTEPAGPRGSLRLAPPSREPSSPTQNSKEAKTASPKSVNDPSGSHTQDIGVTLHLAIFGRRIHVQNDAAIGNCEFVNGPCVVADDVSQSQRFVFA